MNNNESITEQQTPQQERSSNWRMMRWASGLFSVAVGLELVSNNNEIAELVEGGLGGSALLLAGAVWGSTHARNRSPNS